MQSRNQRGRPATGTNQAIGVRIPSDELNLIDDWRSKQRPIPSRPEAIRRLIEMGLQAEPLLADVLHYLEASPSAGERETAETIRALRAAMGR